MATKQLRWMEAPLDTGSIGTLRTAEEGRLAGTRARQYKDRWLGATGTHALDGHGSATAVSAWYRSIDTAESGGPRPEQYVNLNSSLLLARWRVTATRHRVSASLSATEAAVGIEMQVPVMDPEALLARIALDDIYTHVHGFRVRRKPNAQIGSAQAQVAWSTSGTAPSIGFLRVRPHMVDERRVLIFVQNQLPADADDGGSTPETAETLSAGTHAFAVGDTMTIGLPWGEDRLRMMVLLPVDALGHAVAWAKHKVTPAVQPDDD